MNALLLGATATVPTPDVAWRALLPVMVLGIGGILLLTFTSILKARFRGIHYATYTVVVAAIAMATAVPLWARVSGWTGYLWWKVNPDVTGPFSTVGGAVGIDGFSLLLTFLICFSVVLASLFMSDYLEREGIRGPEPYVLLLLSATGGVVMAMANDLIVLFLGLETLSIAVYVLAAMHLRRIQSQEAGLKYFVLGAFSSAFFLYGIAMTYGATGTTNLIRISEFLAGNVSVPIQSELISSVTLNTPLLLLGIALMLVGLGFKVAAVPFHFWSPDVYDGAPSPVVTYMASGVKAAGFAALVRVLILGFSTQANDWRPLVAGLACASLVVGSVLAIVQTNVKRMLAYSSIAHAGFILMALEAASPRGVQALSFYLAAYLFMVAGSFGVVTLVARAGDNRTTLADYRGLGRTNPQIALVFTVFLLAQAGVPLTTGFVAKFYAVAAAVDARVYWLAAVAMLSSVVAAYLYLRIIIAMYLSDDDHGDEPVPAASRIPVPFGAGLALAICLLVTVGFGLFPGSLADVAKKSEPALVQVDQPTASPALPGLGGAPEAPAGAGAPDAGATQDGATPTPPAAP